MHLHSRRPQSASNSTSNPTKLTDGSVLAARKRFRSTRHESVNSAVVISPEGPVTYLRKARLRGVEGLRALAAMSIVVYHTWLYSSPNGRPEQLGLLSRFVLPNLPVGVTLFFILSGFLLYRPIVACVLNGSPLPDIRSYLRNRALRILPAYWVVLLATGILLPAVQVRVSRSHLELGRLIGHPFQLLSNGGLMQNYFPRSLDSGIGPTWSLAVEVGFYLVLPLLGLLVAAIGTRSLTRRGRAAAVLAAPVLMYGVGLLTAWTISSFIRPTTGAWLSILARSFLNHADLFSFGMVVAVVMVNIEDGHLRLPRWWRKPAVATLGVVVCATMILVDRGLILTYRGAVPYETLTAFASALLLALVVLPSPDSSIFPLTRVLQTRAFMAVGLVSYSLFLWHEPIIKWSQHAGLTFPGQLGFLANLLLLGALSAALATLTYRFVERPALARKSIGKRPASSSPPVLDLTGMIHTVPHELGHLGTAETSLE
jgi:peptidoglycan/LPS O-acetylase OafA/YrhL